MFPDYKYINGDCMEYMSKMKDNEYDLAIIDTPYGINFAKQYTGKGWVVRETKEWDKKTPDQHYFNELFRISKNQIVWGGNYLTTFLPPSQGWIFWDKGQRNFSLADGELAYTSFDRALRVFTFSRGEMHAEYRGVKFHPTTKPIALYKWLLQNYAKEGDKILDTHVGSGSSIIACLDLGFDVTGFELDKEYYEASMKRINNFTDQGKLF